MVLNQFLEELTSCIHSSAPPGASQMMHSRDSSQLDKRNTRSCSSTRITRAALRCLFKTSAVGDTVCELLAAAGFDDMSVVTLEDDEEGQLLRWLFRAGKNAPDGLQTA